MTDRDRELYQRVHEEIFGEQQPVPVFDDPDSRYPDGTKVRVTFEGYVRNMSEHNVRYVVYPTLESDWSDPEIGRGAVPLLTPQRQQWARVTKLADPPVAEGTNDPEDQ